MYEVFHLKLNQKYITLPRSIQVKVCVNAEID